jgi:predicted SnoaL-like aldol condensation-catalyzing enzyme
MSSITSSPTISKTSERENEVISHRFHMEIFQEGKLSVANEILTPSFVLRNPILPSELIHGPEGVKKFASLVGESSPEFRIIHHDTISNVDKVMIRWTFTGVLKKEMLGIQPSGEPVTITGFDLFRISSDGKIAEMWQQFNVGSWP